VNSKNEFNGRIAEMQRGIDDGTDIQPWIRQSNIAGLRDILTSLDAGGGRHSAWPQGAHV